MADPANLGQEFQQQLQQTAGEVQQTAAQAQQDVLSFPTRVQQTIVEFLETIRAAVTDFSGGVLPQAVTFFFRCYMGVAFMGLLGFLVGEIGGKVAFYAVVEKIFGKWASVMVLGIVIPLLIWGVGVKLRRMYGDGQMLLLGASLLLGLLIGSTMKMSPIRFITRPRAVIPLGIALAAWAAGASPTLMKYRAVFVLVMMIPGALLAMLIGVHQLSSSYVLYFAIVMIVMLIDLQAKINAANQGESTTLPLEEWKSTVILTIADIAAIWISGEGDEK